MKNNLRELRLRKGKTQKEVGEHLGITEAAYGRWENGQRKLSAEALLALSSYLECTIDDILAPDLTVPHQPGPRDGEELCRLAEAAAGRLGPVDRSLLVSLIRSFMALSAQGRAAAVDQVDTMVRSGKYRRLGVVEFSDGDPGLRAETA